MTITEKFDMRVVSGEHDPNLGPDGEQTPGYTALVIVEGKRSEEVRYFYGLGRISGPNGYESLAFVDLDSTDAEGNFVTRTFLYDCPDGDYSIVWTFEGTGPKTGEVIDFRTDTFSLPAGLHLPAGAPEEDWENV